jgi:hypothetical protein
MSKYIPGGLSLVHHRLSALFIGPRTHPQNTLKWLHTSYDDFLPPTVCNPVIFNALCRTPCAHKKKQFSFYFTHLNYNRLAPSYRVIYLFTRENHAGHPIHYILYTCIRHHHKNLGNANAYIYVIFEMTLCVLCII